ncbi:MAG: GGDEF domain-containing protein [Oscillospiraceae bacterium]|nr:GGDEF domain-containing protein [Oscillospiraceae bacterium]
MQELSDISFEKALDYFGRSVSAVLVVDEKADAYRSLVRRSIFCDILAESGTYSDLVRTLWFHHNDDGRKITDTYNVFIPNMNKFTGKNSRRLKLIVDNIPHIVQLLVLPLEDSDRYLFLLDKLDEHVYEDETETEEKVSSIQNNIYVFTMTFDLVNDTTGSVSLTEVSDEPLNYQISYSQWRETIVNMVPDEDKELFLTRSSPEYLRAHFKPGHMESFDLQMINLDGIYQWVKLIFSRMETTNENDYRFVYMVQNIHEATMNMKATLKHYEELASTDPLTGVFNHGRIETELRNAVEQCSQDGTPAGILILDIDNFKSVNDRYGHAVGDAALVSMAEIIRRTLSDKNAVIGRWGGEEFVVVIYGEDNAALQETAEALRTRIEEVAFDAVGSITASIGLSSLLPNDMPDLWFARADHALYTAKSAGRNRICAE